MSVVCLRGVVCGGGFIVKVRIESGHPPTLYIRPMMLDLCSFVLRNSGNSDNGYSWSYKDASDGNPRRFVLQHCIPAKPECKLLTANPSQMLLSISLKLINHCIFSYLVACGCSMSGMDFAGRCPAKSILHRLVPPNPLPSPDSFHTMPCHPQPAQKSFFHG